MCFHQWQQKCSHKPEFKIRFYISEKNECIVTENATRLKSDTLDQKQYSSFFFPCLFCSPSFLLQVAATSYWAVSFRMLSFSLCASLGRHAQNIPTWDWNSADLLLKDRNHSLICLHLFQSKPLGAHSSCCFA